MPSFFWFCKINIDSSNHFHFKGPCGVNTRIGHVKESVAVFSKLRCLHHLRFSRIQCHTGNACIACTGLKAKCERRCTCVGQYECIGHFGEFSNVHCAIGSHGAFKHLTAVAGVLLQQAYLIVVGYLVRSIPADRFQSAYLVCFSASKIFTGRPLMRDRVSYQNP